MELYGLAFLRYEGYPYTWTNGRKRSNNVQCRLDRCLTTEIFINRFTHIKVPHLPRYRSDHAAIKITLEANICENGSRREHIFIFEEAWSNDTQYKEIVAKLWNNNSVKSYQKCEAMKELEKHFQEYKDNSVSIEIKRIEKLLEDDTGWGVGQEDIEDYKALEKQIHNFLEVEEIISRQRSRALWFKHGDTNTKFSYEKIEQRRKINNMRKLKSDNGQWWRGQEHLERILVNYFLELFTSSSPSKLQEVFSVVKGKLKPKHICWRESRFTSQEVNEALFQMHPFKMGNDIIHLALRF